jgi:hypothetical protein
MDYREKRSIYSTVFIPQDHEVSESTFVISSLSEYSKHVFVNR